MGTSRCGFLRTTHRIWVRRSTILPFVVWTIRAHSNEETLLIESIRFFRIGFASDWLENKSPGRRFDFGARESPPMDNAIIFLAGASEHAPFKYYNTNNAWCCVRVLYCVRFLLVSQLPYVIVCCSLWAMTLQKLTRLQ